MNVLVPQYAVHRDERFFPRANEFIPDRWLNKDDCLRGDEQAYFPFQIGMCVSALLGLGWSGLDWADM